MNTKSKGASTNVDTLNEFNSVRSAGSIIVWISLDYYIPTIETGLRLIHYGQKLPNRVFAKKTVPGSL